MALAVGGWKFVHAVQENNLDEFGRARKDTRAILSPVLPSAIRSFPDLVKSVHFVPYLRALLKLIESEVKVPEIPHLEVRI